MRSLFLRTRQPDSFFLQLIFCCVVYFIIFCAVFCGASDQFSVLNAHSDALLVTDGTRGSREIGEDASANDAESGPVSLLVCEGLVANLTCPVGRYIVVQLANFGRFSLQPCNPTKATDINTACYNEHTTALLKQRCDGERTCIVRSDVASFGGVDPCPNNYKYLDATYSCLHSPTVAVYNNDEASKAATTTKTTTVALALASRSSPSVDNSVVSYEETDLVQSITGSRIRHAHCEGRFARGLQWPETQNGHLARLPCPTGAGGLAEWMCSLSGAWTPDATPDLSRCSAEQMRRLRTEVDEADATTSLAIRAQPLFELYDYSRANALMGGDLIDAVYVLTREVIQLEFAPNTAFDLPALAEETRRLRVPEYFVNVIDNLLGSRQRDAWLDVSAQERRRLADALLNILPRILMQFEPQNIETNMLRVKGDETVHAELAHWPMMDGDTVEARFPRDKESAHSEEDSISVPYAAPEPTRVVYISYGIALGEYLSSSSTVDAMLTSAEDEHEEYVIGDKIVSRVVTFVATNNIGWEIASAANQTDAIQMTLELRHDADERQKLYCVHWRRVGGVAAMTTARWTTADCALIDVNSTHARCKCIASAALSGVAQHFALARNFPAADDASEHRHNTELLVKMMNATLSSYGLLASGVFALVFIALALACVVVFGDSVEWSMQVCARKHICLSLCVFEALLVAGILAPLLSMNNACDELELALRGTALATFFWTLAEVFALGAAFAQNTLHSNRIYCFYAFGYGIPLVFTALAVVFKVDVLPTVIDDCWTTSVVDDRNFVTFFLAPSAVCLAFAALYLVRATMSSRRQPSVGGGYMPCKQQQTANFLKQQQHLGAENLYFNDISVPSSAGKSSALLSLNVRWTLKTSAFVQFLLASCLCVGALWRFRAKSTMTISDDTIDSRVYAAAFALLNCVLGIFLLFGFVLFDATMRQAYEKRFLSKNASLFGKLYQRLSLSFAGSTTSSTTSSALASSSTASDAIKQPKTKPFAKVGGGRSLLLSNASPPSLSHFDCSHVSVTGHPTTTTTTTCCTVSDTSDCLSCSRQVENSPLMIIKTATYCSNSLHYGQTNNNSVYSNTTQQNNTNVGCMHSVGNTRAHGCRPQCGIVAGNQFCSSTVSLSPGYCCYASRTNLNTNPHTACGYNAGYCTENAGTYDYATIPYGDVILYGSGSTQQIGQLRRSPTTVETHCSGSGNTQHLRPICVETPRVPTFNFPLADSSRADYRDSNTNASQTINCADDAAHQEAVCLRSGCQPPRFPPPPPPPPLGMSQGPETEHYLSHSCSIRHQSYVSSIASHSYGCPGQDGSIPLPSLSQPTARRRSPAVSLSSEGGGVLPLASARSVVLRMDLSRNVPLFTEEVHEDH